MQYSSSVHGRSWDLPTRWLKKGLRLSMGIWIRTTTDRQLPTPATAATRYSESIYDPLGLLQPRQIRLLTLRRGLPGDPLRGRLKIVSLHEVEYKDFEALSYVWGNFTQTGSIELNGHDMEIGLNLATALSDVRSPREDIVLWVDALCINQANIDERSQQVAMMVDIYAAAARVLVSLGQSTASSGVGMDVLRDFAEGTSFNRFSRWYALPQEAVTSGLGDIMQRPWFQRYWVVQEAAIARSVVLICGHHQVAWPNTCTSVLRFIRAVKLAVTSPQWSQAGLARIDLDPLLGLLQMQLDGGPQKEVWARRGKGPDLLDFCYTMRDRQATDIRDRIYSLLGLVGKDTVADLMPDYRKSAEEVYDTFAAVVTRQTDAMCAELAALAAKDDAASQISERGPPLGLSADLVTTGDGHATTLDSIVERTCTEAVQRLREDDFWTAAQLLQNTAMFLRSEHFH